MVTRAEPVLTSEEPAIKLLCKRLLEEGVTNLTSVSQTHGAPPPRDLIKRQGAWRHVLISAVILAIVLVLGWLIVSSGAIKWHIVWEYLFAPPVLSGFLVTLELTVLSMLIGIVLGVAAALMVRSRVRSVAWLGKAYIWFFRGTPVLVQLIFWFNMSLVFPTIGFGAWTVPTNNVITPFVAALLGLGINEGAYMSEIFRAGLESVDKGQTEAGLASGMTPTQVMSRVVPAAGTDRDHPTDGEPSHRHAEDHLPGLGHRRARSADEGATHLRDQLSGDRPPDRGPASGICWRPPSRPSGSRGLSAPLPGWIPRPWAPASGGVPQDRAPSCRHPGKLNRHE